MKTHDQKRHSFLTIRCKSRNQRNQNDCCRNKWHSHRQPPEYRLMRPPSYYARPLFAFRFHVHHRVCLILITETADTLVKHR